MKLAPAFRFVALLVFFLGGKSFAASYDLTITNTASPINIGDSITYLIRITNSFAANVGNARLTAEFPAATTVLLATNNIQNNGFDQNLIVTNRGSVVFQIDNFVPNQIYNFSLRLRPGSSGSFTTTFTVLSQRGSESSNVTSLVITGKADLGVGIFNLPTEIIAYDIISYNLSVTNFGPNAASGAIVQNTIPTGSLLVDFSPRTNITKSGDVISWQIGDLANGASQTLRLTIQPTNVANTTVTANIQAPDNSDAVAGNDSATNNLSVQERVTDTLRLTRGTQIFNRQTALIEETVHVVYLGNVTLPSLRVAVPGLDPADRLHNVGGTNGVTPYVLSTEPLGPGGSRDILVQLFIHDRTFKPNLALFAMQGPLPASSTNSPGTNSFSMVAGLSVQGLYLSFPTKIGTNYSVVGASNVLFTNAGFIVFTNTAGGTYLTATNARTTVGITASTNFSSFYRAVENPPIPPIPQNP